jgi:hypothetical protein
MWKIKKNKRQKAVVEKLKYLFKIIKIKNLFKKLIWNFFQNKIKLNIFLKFSLKKKKKKK